MNYSGLGSNLHPKHEWVNNFQIPFEIAIHLFLTASDFRGKCVREKGKTADSSHDVERGAFDDRNGTNPLFTFLLQTPLLKLALLLQFISRCKTFSSHVI